MPKIVNKAEMRDLIMDAALRVFVDKGYHAASVNDVAKDAGLAKGTLYLYFESKEALTTAIVDREFAAIVQGQLRTKPRESLAAFLEDLRQVMDLSAEQAAFYRVFFEVFGPSFASTDFTQQIAGYFDKLGRHYARQIAHLQELGEIAAHHDPRPLGRLLVSMLDGVVLHQGLFGGSKRRKRSMMREAVVLLRAGLQNPPQEADGAGMG